MFLNRLRHSVVLSALLLGLLTSHAQAQAVTFDPTMYATQLLQKVQSGWAASTNSMGQIMQSWIATLNQQNANDNNRINTTMGATQAMATRYALPTGYSACQHAMAARAASDDAAGGAAMAQALAQGMANKPATPSMNAQEIKAECALNFAPSDSKDPESSIYKAVGCNSSGAHARQDRTLSSLLGPMEYPVPPEMKAPTNGVYQPINSVSSDTYTPFVAALRFCEHATPSLPPPPQGGSVPTSGALMIGPYAAMEAQVSVVTTLCTTALERRMQYGSNVDSSLKPRYQTQLDRCTADNKRGYIDDNALSDCTTNGRSELQAEHDEAYRLQGAAFSQKVLAAVGTDAMYEMTDKASQDQQTFEQNKANERTSFIQAMQAAAGVSKLGANPLDMPVNAGH